MTSAATSTPASNEAPSSSPLPLSPKEEEEEAPPSRRNGMRVHDEDEDQGSQHQAAAASPPSQPQHAGDPASEEEEEVDEEEEKKETPPSEEAPSSPPPQTTGGFRMEFHNHHKSSASRNHRKRKRDVVVVGLERTPRENKANTSGSLSSSSSSSSDEEELPRGPLTPASPASPTSPPLRKLRKDDEEGSLHSSSDTTTDTQAAAETEPQSPPSVGPQPGQPDGWRVKLYRLNADGSWDDCGTGRILCLYKKGETSTTSSPPNNTTPKPEGLTGDAWIYHELGEPTLCMHSEVQLGERAPRILLRTRILLRDAYQRQGDNIITWCEPYLEDGNPAQGVDLALSFQDNAGCLDIWKQITQVQSKAADLFRRTPESSSNSGEGHHATNGETSQAPKAHSNTTSVTEVARAVAAAHHADLQRQQQEMWVNVASEAAQHHMEQQHQNSLVDSPRASHHHDQHFDDAVGMVAAYHEATNNGPPMNSNNTPQSPQLPNPPMLANLEEIADTIAAVQHIQQRESLAMYIAQNECSYLKSLLSLFPSAESRGDYGSLATLAACVKTILLLNDPSIIELIVSDELIFEEVCSTLEYDPDLRDKSNHRWFLRERAKFRTVVLMEDEELIVAIHRSFRVNYLRDTLLRPTMDENSLSTLSSLQTFTHSDVVKGVTMSPTGTDEKEELLKDSYLAKVIRMLGRELEAICEMEWEELENVASGGGIQTLLLNEREEEESPTDTSTVVANGKYPQSQKMSTIWKQHLAPQDGSLASRRFRRRGSLSFLRELFNMVRISLQQSDKDDFFAVLVSMEVDLEYDDTPKKTSNLPGKTTGEAVSEQDSRPPQEEEKHRLKPVNLLSLLGTVLADPNTDVTEKGSVLEIISGIAMHDPSLIRRRCLDTYSTWKRERRAGVKYFDPMGPVRPNPNEKRQLIFQCPPNDLLASLMFLLAVETDAGVLLQVSEIMRIILDTDMMGDHGPMGVGFADEAEGIPPGHSPPHEQHINHAGTLTTSSDQNQFLSVYYEHYIEWLAAPFQYRILHPVRRIPNHALHDQGRSPLLQGMIERFEKGQSQNEFLLRLVPQSAIRSSFAVELLSFCVRAHLYRMKCYLLRSQVPMNVLKLLKIPKQPWGSSGDRCLKLAALRFFRAILSVNDEFYHRHIIQHNLFALVFEAFRANPVGDNLVSSAIVEMCDFVHQENIKSLVEHIVTKHLSTTSAGPMPSLEDVSSPYVSTLTVLREAYEKNLKAANAACIQDSQKHPSPGEEEPHSRYFHGKSFVQKLVVMNKKAREDQRKFREADQEESYFDTDDDDDEEPSPSTVVPPAVDEVAAQEGENELSRTARMFSLAQAPPLNTAQRHLEDQTPANSEHDTGLPLSKQDARENGDDGNGVRPVI